MEPRIDQNPGTAGQPVGLPHSPRERDPWFVERYGETAGESLEPPAVRSVATVAERAADSHDG